MKKEHIAIPADPDDDEDFDVSIEAMERGQRARVVRRLRKNLGLTQSEFASRFRIPVGTLRDWEQARSTPPDFAMAYMRVIALDPELAADAAA